MRLSHIFITVLLAISGFAKGQNFEEFRPLQAQGEIPLEFTTPSFEKYKQATANLKTSDKEVLDTESKQDFLLESNFLIDQVLTSGRVLFNDPVSQYLSLILDTILVDEPELRTQIQVYAVRSAGVNSFTTNNGIILVNIGLLAQLETEAQLAFILCHELAHFTEKHIINAYLQNEEFKKEAGARKVNSFDEKLLAKNRYSQNLEVEADKLGFERFKRTGYSQSSILNVFEVMRYAHLPFDDIPFDKDFFNQEYYKINDSYFLNRVRPVEPLEDGNDFQGSHPSPTDRQRLMSKNLTKSTIFKKYHIVSEIEFRRIRDICRFDLSDLYLQTDRPVMSIYNSFLLLKSHPNNIYLEKNIAKSLYTLSKFKTGGNFGQVHPGFSHIEGESQQVYHLFYRLRPEELSVLATGYIWRMKQRYPNDLDLLAMSKDLLDDLMSRYYVPGMISQTKPPEGWNTPDTTAATGKYERLKQKSKNNPRLTMIKYGLVDLFENSEFQQLFETLEFENWGGQNAELSSQEIRQKTKDDVRYWKKHGFALGAEKMVVVSPSYAKLDLREKQKHRFLYSEVAKVKFVNQINKSSELLTLDIEILDLSKLDSSQVETFNDITFLNQWVDQRFVQLEVSIINQPQKKIDLIIEKYGTEYFTWTGVINYRESNPFRASHLLYVLMPPAIPFGIYNLAKPNFDTFYYCITFNLRTGEPVMVNYNNFLKRDTKDLINSSIYDSFWQMKRTQRKKE